MTDQKLTDELEKALRDEAYDGGMGALTPEQLTDYVRGLAVTAAQVAEKAHTPTDDEREAITDEGLWDFASDLLDAWNIEDLNPPSLVEDFRDRFVRRFRRTEVPEPSGASVTLAKVHEFATRERDSIRARYGLGAATYTGYANACDDILGLIGGMSPYPSLSEPQGEPSDAQRDAAMDEAWGGRAETRPIYEKWAAQHWFNSGWRAALRAAGSAR